MSDDTDTSSSIFALMAISTTAKAHAVRKCDLEITEIGDPRDLNKHLPNSDATQHVNLHLADLYDMVEEHNLGMEVADSSSTSGRSFSKCGNIGHTCCTCQIAEL
jgi:hypothetical protein